MKTAHNELHLVVIKILFLFLKKVKSMSVRTINFFKPVMI